MSVSAFLVRFFKSTRPERPDLHESSAELLHELLHGLSTEVDGATLRCAPASDAQLACIVGEASEVLDVPCNARILALQYRRCRSMALPHSFAKESSSTACWRCSRSCRAMAER